MDSDHESKSQGKGSYPDLSLTLWLPVRESASQFATRRTGFTRRNFTARSGVVSGQSSSKVMGMVLARSNSFNSSGVKANSLQIPNDRQISCGGIPYRIIAILITAVSLIIKFDTVIIKGHTGGAHKGYSVFFNIFPVFLRIILKE